MSLSRRSELTPAVWSLCGIAIVSVAVILRLYDLDLKPLHHDEGVNGLLVTWLVQPPYTYRYDPAHFHGPTLYYLVQPLVAWLGLTTFAIRLLPAVCGIVIVLLAFGLRRWIGAVGAVTSAGLLAVSPGAVYFARYFIHETLLVCFTLATVVAAWHYHERRRPKYLLLASALAGLMFATKETASIAAGVLVAAAAATYVLLALVRGTIPRPAIQGQRRLIGHAVACAAIFVGLNAVFYSSFFTHWAGLGDAIVSFALWTETGTRDHLQPWHTYLRWLGQQEGLVLALGILGSGLALWSRRDAFAVFAALWALGMLLVYSLIPYKTPWLTLNIIIPFAIAGGWFAEAVHARIPAAWRPRLAAAGVVLVLATSGWQALSLNFVRYDDDRQGYVYAHTRRALLDLVERVHHIGSRAPAPLTIAVVSPEHFPLSWYLNGYPAGYYGTVTDTRDAVFIGSVQQDDALRLQLGEDYVRGGAYALRPGVDLVLYVRRDLASP